MILTPQAQIIELGGRLNPTTNNQMEMLAAIQALEEIEEIQGSVQVWTDSTYLIRGITQWIWGWRSRDWKTADGKEVSNRELWQRLLRILGKRTKENPISWNYVRGHTGVPGNERVDEIAAGFAQGRRPALYRGTLLGYSVAITDLPDSGEMPEQRPREAKVAAHSYLSFVHGKLKRHTTWAECERWVKGQPGAKFKKAVSSADEAKIVESWGLSLEQISGD